MPRATIAVSYALCQHRIVAGDHRSYESHCNESVVLAKILFVSCADKIPDAYHNQSHPKEKDR